MPSWVCHCTVTVFWDWAERVTLKVRSPPSSTDVVASLILSVGRTSLSRITPTANLLIDLHAVRIGDIDDEPFSPLINAVIHGIQ